LVTDALVKALDFEIIVYYILKVRGPCSGSKKKTPEKHLTKPLWLGLFFEKNHVK